MTAKQELLKPQLLASIERMRKFVELDAPGVIVGAEAFLIFSTTLAAYGDSAGSALLSYLMEQNLQRRGLCSHGDCTGVVPRPDVPICEACQKELGIDDASMSEIEAEAQVLEATGRPN